MKASDRKQLQDALKAMSNVQRRELYKRAAQMRKAAGRQKHAPRTDYDRHYHQKGHIAQDGPPDRPPAGTRRPVSLDEWALKILTEQLGNARAKQTQLAQCTQDGQVIALRAAVAMVRSGESTVECLLRPEISMGQKTDIAVGDFVAYSTAPDGTHIVEEIHERNTMLARPDPRNPDILRIMAANIDIVVIVASVVQPRLEPRLIDRYLLMIERGGCQPVICINKMDMLDAAGRRKVLDRMGAYINLGIQTIPCSAQSREGIDTLGTILSGKLCVLVGHSGVGKSSLLNAMDPALQLATKQVRPADGKGRHTTTSSAIYDLAGGIRLIDTPGIRSMGMWNLAPHELRWYFPEFEPLSPSCKFSDCTHIHEPNCAIREAVDRGEIAHGRYDSYVRLWESLGTESRYR